MVATTEQEAWSEFYGNSYECFRARKKAGLAVKNLFPKDGSLRLFIDELYRNYVLQNKVFIQKGLRYLNDVHPKAWELILKYGKDYHPRSFKFTKPHKSRLQPVKSKCHANSYKKMCICNRISKTTLVTYVEGFAAGARVVPMLHAWNGEGVSDTAIDWTFYATTVWTRYFGISFTHDEYNFITSNSNGESSVHFLFDKAHFENVESKILEILESRAV